MWIRRHECEFLVVTIASRSNFTSYYDLDKEFFEVDKVSSLRNAEAAVFVRLLGAQHRALDQLDAVLRYHGGDWSLDWYRRHRSSISAFVAHHSGEEELRAWTAAVRAVLSDIRADEVWIPLGSPHTDHQLARSACLTALLEDASLVGHSAVRLYQEVPYAARYPTFTASVVDTLTRLGASLIPEAVPITAVFADKLRLVSLYRSQFELGTIRADVEASARMAAGDSGMAELFWRLERLPKTLEPLSLCADERVVHHTAQQLSRWVRRHRQANGMRILLLFPAGRWAEDMEFLFRTFPAAHFDVYVSPSTAAEVADFTSPRIRAHPIGAGRMAWVRLAFGLSLTRPMPTLFLAGERRLREARGLAALWPMSDPVVLPTMDHLVLSLRQL